MCSRGRRKVVGMMAIIAGSGRLGSGLARVLSAKGDDVVVIGDKIDARWLGNDFDGVTVEGDPIDEDVLEAAGLRKADLFVAATSDDVVNAMAVQIAKTVFHVPLALARMTDPAREGFYRSIGLDTVCPTSTGINQILDRIQRFTFAPLEGHLDSGLAGVIPLPGWTGKALGMLDLPRGRHVIGIERRGKLVAADDSTVLVEGDVLVMRRTGTWRQES